MRKQIYGTCKLCGKQGALTYEHVPPRGAFNSSSKKMISGDTLLEHIESDRKPWDIPNVWGKIYQQGTGGYYLCRKCNENTGAWYVPAYLDFIYGMYSAIKRADSDGEAPYIQIKASSIQPLPIFKEIMVMFCDINHNFFEDDNLRTFLLNKDNIDGFDKNKYRVFCYVAKGDLCRINGLSVLILSSRDKGVLAVPISEISFPPLGFALYINMPDGYEPKGCEITQMSGFHYNDITESEMVLPVLENNIIFSGDYRTKAEINKTIEDNKRWEEEHQDLINSVTNGSDNS